jgi:hypothetical protein
MPVTGCYTLVIIIICVRTGSLFWSVFLFTQKFPRLTCLIWHKSRFLFILFERQKFQIFHLFSSISGFIYSFWGKSTCVINSLSYLIYLLSKRVTINKIHHLRRVFALSRQYVSSKAAKCLVNTSVCLPYHSI